MWYDTSRCDMEDNLLTRGDYRKKILGFMWPILVGQFFQQMYNTADALIVGNFLNAESLAAVTSTSSLVFLVIGFCLGFSSGAVSGLSVKIGAAAPIGASGRGIYVQQSAPSNPITGDLWFW